MRENRGRNNSRKFRFNTSDEALKFILMYKDLFVPYSDYICNYESVDRSGKLINHKWVKSENYGNRDENVRRMLEQGYRIYDDMKTLKVNITPETLDEILSSGCFEKVKEYRNRYCYEMKKAA